MYIKEIVVLDENLEVLLTKHIKEGWINLVHHSLLLLYSLYRKFTGP